MSARFFLPKSDIRIDTNAGRRRHFVEPIRRYEAAKQQWIAKHPEATSAEYQAAMTAIACRVGV
jgi:hypothetical protein